MFSAFYYALKLSAIAKVEELKEFVNIAMVKAKVGLKVIANKKLVIGFAMVIGSTLQEPIELDGNWQVAIGRDRLNINKKVAF